ncbi:glycoside hydrolase family protein [Aquimarina sp. ERC-38]|uniref:glycoside hydrolase family protein n=1 Tax=Aquimarina sp. ERC-38 TaxID=2949996 RepID=UPI0022470707|nr:glycoside hydrolase family protein [Aquimarina sp. ERC-38]UZO82226.1 glycoside hydrolase family protein [Aquimarina sp. ERC-38]
MVREKPAVWKNLVLGGRFVDRIKLMPNLGGMTSDTWGSANVIPRDVNNGIEDPDWSYWGGNTRLDKDGLFHLIVCRWPEKAEKGHFEWPESTLVHAVSKNSYGPYKVIKSEGLGKGHNPEWYISKNGKCVIYTIDKRYIADSINGIWQTSRYQFDDRDRKDTKQKNYMTNCTFTQREDGSFLMINRHGQSWFSKDGISTFYRVSETTNYPKVAGKFEDPFVWRDHVQYYMIVNDWKGRMAWYLRSKDGVDWVVDPGEAYMPGSISKHENGIHEDWFKYERVKLNQDKFGRVYQANFAVIDTLKHSDLGNDTHSSKWIAVPLNKGVLAEIENKNFIDSKTKEIKIKILAEDDFDPHTAINIKSLRFGASEEVNFGGGSKVLKTVKSGKDLIVVFSGKGNGLTKDNFAGKLLGKTMDGNLLFGYSKLPGITYITPILSSRLPEFTLSNNGLNINVEVENFGQIVSNKSKLKINLIDISGREIVLGTATVGQIEPFGKEKVKIKSSGTFVKGEKLMVRTIIESKNLEPISLTKNVIVK